MSENAFGSLPTIIDYMTNEEIEAMNYPNEISQLRAEFESKDREIEALRTAVRAREKDHLEVAAELDELQAECAQILDVLKQHVHLGHPGPDSCFFCKKVLEFTQSSESQAAYEKWKALLEVADSAEKLVRLSDNCFAKNALKDALAVLAEIEKGRT